MATQGDFYPEVGLSQRDDVSRLQADAAGTGGNGDGFAVSKDVRTMRAAIVANAIRGRCRCAFDMSVLPRDAEVWPFGALVKGDIVRPDQTIAIVADFRTPAQIYPATVENIFLPLSRAFDNGQRQGLLGDDLLGRGVSRTVRAVELDIKFGIRPVGLGLVDIVRGDT